MGLADCKSAIRQITNLRYAGADLAGETELHLALCLTPSKGWLRCSRLNGY